MDENTARQRLRYLELKAKAGAAPVQPEAKGSLYAFGSGAVRAVPQTLDLAGATVAEVADRAIGGEGGYFKGFMQPAQTPMNDLTTAVVGPEYDAQGFGENAAKFAGGVVGPLGVVKGAKNFAGFLKGLGGSMDDYIRDPAKLKEIYGAWKDGLENIKVEGKDIAENLINPTIEKIGKDAKYATKEGKDKLDEFVNLWAEGGDLGDVYALRKSLGKVNDREIVEPIRQSTKGFLEAKVGVEGLDAYRRAMLLEEFQHALRNAGNEGLKATRTKINNLDETGMSAVELAAKRRAGNPTTLESFTQGVQSSLGAIPSTIMAGPLAPLLYGAGKAVGAGGRIGSRAEMKALQEVLLNKRDVPNLGERSGAALRKVLQGK